MKEHLLHKVAPAVLALLLLSGTFGAGFYFGGQKDVSAEAPQSLFGTDGTTDGADFTAFWKAWNLLDEKFVGASTTEKVSDQERVWGAIQGMVGSMGDPYTVFLPPVEKKMFDEDISGNFEGVGMEVGIKDDVLTVIAPLKNTPAYNAGILSGDKILSINGTSTQSFSVDEAVKQMRGKKGTTVTLNILHPEATEPVDIVITRDVIDIPTIETETKEGIFIIRLYNFSAISANQFRGALREFINSKSDKLILDLRGNPGGYLEAAVDMASWFLPAGKVVVRENFGTDTQEEVIRSKGYDVFNENLKFVVLVNGGSASASEILAGALQEHGKAKLVGTKTYGKGSVQELVSVTPETSLKVTIAQWMTPNGISISANGLKPDFEVPMTLEEVKSGNDVQLKKAIDIIKNW